MDLLEWPSGRCAVCLASGNLTRAHVLTETLGGKMAIRCLCAECNSRAGHTFEAHLRRDPSIQWCVEAVASELPQALVDRIFKGARWSGETPHGRIELVRASGGRLTPARHEHESGFWRETGDDSERLIRNLVGSQVDQETLERGLSELRAAPPDTPVQIGPVTVTTRVGEMEIHALLEGPLARVEAMVATAYLFACGALGAAVFDPAFDSTRGLLGGATSGGAPPDVEVLLGRRPGPWHGVRMIAGCPKLVIEVVHFGCLVHRVTFPVAVDTRKLGYKVDVARGVDSLIYQADDGSWYSADVQ